MTTGSSLRTGARTAAALACALLAACAGPASEPPLEVSAGTVLRGLTVVDPRNGRLQPNMTVVVADGRISAVTARPVRAGGNVQVVEAQGRFVVPGYHDMHTHALLHGANQPTLWPLLVAHGITGIREMAGSPEAIQAARQLNAESSAGRVVAPEIVSVAGPLFLGAPNAEAAAAIVRQQKALGAGFLKAIGGSREATLAMLREARVQGLAVAGHVPMFVTSQEAAEAGWRSIEHLGAGMGILLDCAADPDAIRQAILRGEGARPVLSPLAIMSPMLFRAVEAPFYQRILQTYNEPKCAAVAAAFARHGTWQVPTLIRVRTMMYSDAPFYRSNPDLRYIDAATRTQWEQLAQQYERMPGEAAAAFRAYFEQQKKLIPLFQRAGVKMLTGSDYGGIWVVPGASLHQEFRELAAAGLTPLEILRMATANAAEFLQREGSHGTVAAGQEADLVLLEANPLADVANLGRIAGVVLNGRYFSGSDLQQMKDSAAAAVR
ncbi:MAG TPA: amidohydrolase family protein [Ramlibacter sp.]|nr:amidohydrolase family protein [Ramlibacter sp.]